MMTSENPGLSPEFWRVYHYVAKQWYETEYGAVDLPKRWYHPTVLRLEDERTSGGCWKRDDEGHVLGPVC